MALARPLVHHHATGDWICPKEGCNNHNFASRVVCRMCNTPKPEGAGMQPGAPGMAPQQGPQHPGQQQQQQPGMYQQQQPYPGYAGYGQANAYAGAYGAPGAYNQYPGYGGGGGGAPGFQ
eukprot:m.86042 g.86042  ORF g.86042 m.86042 type:complete len:120 (+) comp9653_c0_seq1:1199-1558(+)